ncbi:MAG: ABC transporter permease subunit, partial [Candidatus Borkfalkiaceae bacterium]|nr:ABC transporter permease subunit [Christensenellaceae bacterium]
ATAEGSDGLTVTPVKATARETGIRDGGAFSEEGEYDLFAGYVVFRLRGDNTPWIAAGVVAAGIAALVALGFATGAFKRFFHGKTWGKIVKNRMLYLFVLPAFVVFALFNYAPMVGIVVAFKNYTVDGGIFGSEWAGQHGFEHFITLFTHPGSEFGMIFRNTVVMAFLKFVTGFPAAIVLALMFNALKNGLFKKTAQTVSYLPYFVSWVVVSNIVYLLLSANGGIFNNLIVRLGGEKIRFYSEPKYWWGILTATSLWKTVGWGTIVYLAAITAINPDLYEAASIDGAGGWRKLWTVTIPGMMPVIGIQLILNAGNMIKDDFDQIYSLVGGSNYELREVTEVFSSLVFRNLQSGVKGFSSSAAISLVQSVISLGLVLGADAIVRKTDNPGLW